MAISVNGVVSQLPPIRPPENANAANNTVTQQNWNAGNANTAANDTSSFMSYADMLATANKNMDEARQRAAAELAAAQPPTKDDMLEMLKDGTLTAEEAKKCTRMSREDKLAMLESWGMKPKHTDKDPSGVDNLFNHVVDAMKGGVGKQKLKFAGSKFKLVIKKGPNGELTAGFKRKKPSIFKKILHTVGKVLKSIGPFLNIIPGFGTLASLAVTAIGTVTERLTAPKKQA